MKKYQIDEKLINEVIDLMESYRQDLTYTDLSSNNASHKRWKTRELRRKLRALKKVKYFIFKIGIRK